MRKNKKKMKINNDINSIENEVYKGNNTVIKPKYTDKVKEIVHTAELKERMWTRGFWLLWQGQLVSLMGDAAYAIALGFWVLSVTGSTALMGTLMATSTLPGILVGPFAGVLVDRSDRRFIMVLMDVLRGLSIIFIGIEGLMGLLQVWMVFAAGIILSLCGAFFQPSVYSIIPDIVPESKIVNANSAFSMLSLGSTTIGNSAGGFLYQLMGAPFMFLFNGISFIFSGISLIFVKVPQFHKKKEQHFSKDFFNDFKEGILFVWNFKGLRYVFFMGTIKQGLTPIAMALGGVLGEVLPIRVVISSCCIISLIMSILFMILPQFKHFINYDPKVENVQDIM